MFNKKEYDQAIVNLVLGKCQLEPDGNNCSICGDNEHQAWECHHNPLRWKELAAWTELNQ